MSSPPLLAMHGCFCFRALFNLPALFLLLFFRAPGRIRNISVSRPATEKRKQSEDGRRRQECLRAVSVQEQLSRAKVNCFFRFHPFFFKSDSPWPRRRSAPERASCLHRSRHPGRMRWLRCRGRPRSHRRKPRLSCSSEACGQGEEGASFVLSVCHERPFRVD